MEDNLQNKQCARCKCIKQYSDFNKSLQGRLGLHNHCRQCQKEIRRKWYLENKSHEIEKNKLPANIEKQKQWRINKYKNEEWKSETLRKNRERRRQESAKIKAREQRRRWYNIPKNRIACSLRVRLRKALKFNQKIDVTEKLLGCSFEYAKQYLESKFADDMSWENYGTWHIDHIIPCSFFNLSDPNQQIMCFNYRNLQPLSAIKNISKNNKITIDSHLNLLNELKSLISH